MGQNWDAGEKGKGFEDLESSDDSDWKGKREQGTHTAQSIDWSSIREINWKNRKPQRQNLSRIKEES